MQISCVEGQIQKYKNTKKTKIKIQVQKSWATQHHGTGMDSAGGRKWPQGKLFIFTKQTNKHKSNLQIYKTDKQTLIKLTNIQNRQTNTNQTYKYT